MIPQRWKNALNKWAVTIGVTTIVGCVLIEPDTVLGNAGIIALAIIAIVLRWRME